jgi:hypothetical protein
MTQIKNNLSAFGKAISFTIGDGGEVDFLGECDVSEEDLLSSAAQKQSKIELATQLISTMLATEDKKSNDIYDACLNAGISSSTMQHVKKLLGIKSIHKIDDWYWTARPETVGCDDDDVTVLESMSDHDETPVTFLEDVENPLPADIESMEPEGVTISSPFGVLRLIDWRSCV